MSKDLDLSLKITADSKVAQEAMDDLVQSIESLDSENKDAAESFNNAEKSAKDLGDQTKSLSSDIKNLTAQESDIKKIGDAFKSIGGEIKSLGGTLTLVTAPLTAIAGLGLKNIFDLGDSLDGTGAFREFADSVRTLKDNFTELTVEVGSVVLPYVQQLINAANNIIASFRRMSDETKQLLVTLGAIAVVVGPSLVLFGSLAETFGRLLVVIKPVMAALSSSTAIFAAKAVAVAALVVSLAGLVNVFIKLREAGTGAIESLNLSLQLFIGFFTKYVIGNIVKGISIIVNSLGSLASYISKSMGDGIKALGSDLDQISDIMSVPFDNAKAQVDDKLSGIGSSAGEAFTFGFSEELEKIQSGFKDIFKAPDLSDLSSEASSHLNNLKAGFDSLKITVDQVNRSIEQSISGTVTDGLMSMIDGTKSVAEAFADMARKIVQDLIRIMIQAQITNAIAGSLGGGAARGGGAFGFATGGYVSGAGSSMSDSIPARLSNGEYVVRASSVKKVGIGFLDYINGLGSRSFKRKIEGNFADGGSVSQGVTGDVKVEIINSGGEKEVTDASYNPETLVVSVIMEDLGRNGPISKGMGNAFGIRRASR